MQRLHRPGVLAQRLEALSGYEVTAGQLEHLEVRTADGNGAQTRVFYPLAAANIEKLDTSTKCANLFECMIAKLAYIGAAEKVERQKMVTCVGNLANARVGQSRAVLEV